MIVTVSERGQLELPPEIQSQSQPGDNYEISVTNEAIVLKKVERSLDWEELSQRIEELGEDPDQPTLEEISDIVKEVRRERRMREQQRELF